MQVAFYAWLWIRNKLLYANASQANEWVWVTGLTRPIVVLVYMLLNEQISRHASGTRPMAI